MESSDHSGPEGHSSDARRPVVTTLPTSGRLTAVRRQRAGLSRGVASAGGATDIESASTSGNSAEAIPYFVGDFVSFCPQAEKPHQRITLLTRFGPKQKYSVVGEGSRVIDPTQLYSVKTTLETIEWVGQNARVLEEHSAFSPGRNYSYGSLQRELQPVEDFKLSVGDEAGDYAVQSSNNEIIDQVQKSIKTLQSQEDGGKVALVVPLYSRQLDSGALAPSVYPTLTHKVMFDTTLLYQLMGMQEVSLEGRTDTFSGYPIFNAGEFLPSSVTVVETVLVRERAKVDGNIGHYLLSPERLSELANRKVIVFGVNQIAKVEVKDKKGAFEYIDSNTGLKLTLEQAQKATYQSCYAQIAAAIWRNLQAETESEKIANLLLTDFGLDPKSTARIYLDVLSQPEILENMGNLYIDYVSRDPSACGVMESTLTDKNIREKYNNKKAAAEKAKKEEAAKAEKERKAQEARAEKERKAQEAKAEKERAEAEKERKAQEARTEKDGSGSESDGTKAASGFLGRIGLATVFGGTKKADTVQDPAPTEEVAAASSSDTVPQAPFSTDQYLTQGQQASDYSWISKELDKERGRQGNKIDNLDSAKVALITATLDDEGLIPFEEVAQRTLNVVAKILDLHQGQYGLFTSDSVAQGLASSLRAMADFSLKAADPLPTLAAIKKSSHYKLVERESGTSAAAAASQSSSYEFKYNAYDPRAVQEQGFASGSQSASSVSIVIGEVGSKLAEDGWTYTKLGTYTPAQVLGWIVTRLIMDAPIAFIQNLKTGKTDRFAATFVLILEQLFVLRDEISHFIESCAALPVPNKDAADTEKESYAGRLLEIKGDFLKIVFLSYLHGACSKTNRDELIDVLGFFVNLGELESYQPSLAVEGKLNEILTKVEVPASGLDDAEGTTSGSEGDLTVPPAGTTTRVTPSALEEKIAEARQSVVKASLRLEDRKETLNVAQDAFQTAQAEYNQAQAECEQAQAEFEQAKTLLDKLQALPNFMKISGDMGKDVANFTNALGAMKSELQTFTVEGSDAFLSALLSVFARVVEDFTKQVKQFQSSVESFETSELTTSALNQQVKCVEEKLREVISAQQRAVQAAKAKAAEVEKLAEAQAAEAAEPPLPSSLPPPPAVTSESEEESEEKAESEEESEEEAESEEESEEEAESEAAGGLVALPGDEDNEQPEGSDADQLRTVTSLSAGSMFSQPVPPKEGGEGEEARKKGKRKHKKGKGEAAASGSASPAGLTPQPKGKRAAKKAAPAVTPPGSGRRSRK